jgi:succinate dehydrogenase / fumarate reductase flavoprotein subunit
VTAWEWSGNPSEPIEHREKLEYEVVHLATRSYK